MKFSNVNGQKKKKEFLSLIFDRSFIEQFVDKNSYFINNFPKIYPTFWKSYCIDRLFVMDVVVAPFGTKNLSLSPRRRLRENGGGCKKRSRIVWDEKRCSRNEARVVKRSRAKGKRFPSCSRRRLAFNRRRRGRAARAEVVYAGSTTSDRAREPPIETAGSGFRGLPPSRNCSSLPAILPRNEETVPGTWW